HSPMPWPTESSAVQEPYARCLAHLKKLRKLSGEVKWTPESRAWWEKWYCEHSKLVPKRQPNLQGWFATKPDQVLKIGMLTMLSESLDLVLQPKHFEVALRLLEILEQTLDKVFGGTGRNE